MIRGMLALGLALLCSNLVQAQSQGIDGREAPEWGVTQWHQLPDGKESLDLSDFEGKTVYLYCFQSWCPGCHSRGFPTLKAVADHYAGDDKVAFVAVQTVFEGFSTNTFAKAKAVAEKFELSIPIGHTAGNQQNHTPELMRNYRTGGTPWTVIIDPDGQVRFNGFHITEEDAVQLIDALKVP